MNGGNAAAIDDVAGAVGREILGPRTWGVVAVAGAVYATVQPVASYLSFDFGGISLREHLEALSPSLGPTTAFAYLLATLAALAAYRAVPAARLRGLLGAISLCSGFVAAYGLMDVWHYLTIKVNGLGNVNESIGLALQRSEAQRRLAGVLWGGTAVFLATVTIALAFPVVTQARPTDTSPSDDEPPEPVELEPAR
jgi:hypothetical protein